MTGHEVVLTVEELSVVAVSLGSEMNGRRILGLVDSLLYGYEVEGLSLFSLPVVIVDNSLIAISKKLCRLPRYNSLLTFALDFMFSTSDILKFSFMLHILMTIFMIKMWM